MKKDAKDLQFDRLIARGLLDEDDRIVGKLFTRREALVAAGTTSLAVMIGCGGGGSHASGTSTTTGTSTASTTGTTTSTGTTTGTTGTTGGIDLTATPDAIVGPFFVEEKLLRSDLVSSGASRTTVENGNPYALTLKVYTISAADGLAYPLIGAYVDLWHCDTIGVYSDEASGNIQSENTVGQNWLRGYQVTDATGAVTFDTIFPGWYTGRTTHFHLKIRTYDSSNNVTHQFITQLFMSDALTTAVYAANSAYGHGTRGVYNASDNVYAVTSGGSEIGPRLTLSPTPSTAGSASTAYSASFNIAFVLSSY